MNKKLDKISAEAPKSLSRKKIEKETQEMYILIKELHKKMRAECKHSMLFVFQGMDASGKDGSIYKLYNGLYPMAVHAHSFKAPNEYEASKDFLWRIHNLTPVKGHISIFNRSHYEDILVPSVHKFFDKNIIEKRYDHINNFEELLEDNGTHVVKFFLHISKKEQAARFEERANSVEKKWKYNSKDLEESALWDEYMDVYEKIFDKSKIKWNIIPSDNKWYRNYVIAKVLLEKMQSLKMKYPEELK